MGYALLEMEKVPEVLRDKPRWVTCIAFATAVLVLITSAVAIGIFIGYTYCYLEYKTGIRSGNITTSTNLHIMRVPLPESEETVLLPNRTINGAMMSNMLVSRILTIGQALMNNELSVMPWSNEEVNIIQAS